MASDNEIWIHQESAVISVDERKVLLDRLAGMGRKDVADRIQQYLDIVDDEP